MEKEYKEKLRREIFSKMTDCPKCKEPFLEKCENLSENIYTVTCKSIKGQPSILVKTIIAENPNSSIAFIQSKISEKMDFMKENVCGYKFQF